MIITVMAPKGGVGKTTTTIYLATALQREGHTVSVLDLDPMRGATQWAELAAEDNDPLPFTVTPVHASTLATAIDHGTDFTLIDTPPGDPVALDAARDAADLIILPTRATRADMLQMWKTRAAVETVPHGALLVFLRAGTAAPQEARDAIDQLEMPRFNAEIPLREDVAANYGLTPRHLHGYDALAAEITTGD